MERKRTEKIHRRKRPNTLAKELWKEVFKPPCWGKFPWDHDAQATGRCMTCEQFKQCSKEIKRKANKNYEDFLSSIMKNPSEQEKQLVKRLLETRRRLSTLNTPKET